jgi:arylformamidase
MQDPVRTRRQQPAGPAPAAGALAAIGGAASAQQLAPARPKGPLVWRDMDQRELDDAYDQLKWASNRDQLGHRRAVLSEIARTRLGAPKRFAYGAGAAEGLDVYLTGRANAPVNVFIHGGAWRSGAAKDFGVLAELFVNAGAHFVALDFNSVEETGGDLMALADQVRHAVAWVYRNAAQFGGDPNRVYVTGHSSGAHLGGCVLVTDWEGTFGLPRDVVKGALLSSGMYELEPVRLSKRSQYVTFTDETVGALSAIRHLDRLNCPLILAHGTCESPEFMRQTRDFAAAVKAAGTPVTLIVAESYNHFEMLEALASPYGLLGRAVLAQMGLGMP